MCCGGNKTIRSSTQPIRTDSARQKVVSVQRISKQSVSTESKSLAAKPVNIVRQYSVPRQKCPKCQNPTMLVHIAGRERQQCTNLNCKNVIR